MLLLSICYLVPKNVYSMEDRPLIWQSSSTLTDSPKYGAHFDHYDYVNPSAPKGGSLNMISVGTFDSFNPYVLSGTTPSGLPSFGGGLLYESLMDGSLDQSGVAYANIAQATMAPEDYSWVKFKINPQAYWHDGQPITVDDVIWSFNTLIKISPLYQSYYRAVDHVEQSGKNEVTFVFKTKGNRELPKIMGDLAILPKHWWQGFDKNGKQRDITKPTLEIPLGSGPYKIVEFAPGKYVLWQRVANFWGRNLPQNIGRNNFDQLKFNFFMDGNAAWEAFKKGGIGDYRLENIIQRWQQDYEFPAVKAGRVKKATFPYKVGIFQAYFLNTRLPKFSDIRVRKALNLALDFNMMNRTIFFNKYQRITSYFGNQHLSATGLPIGREREILEMVRNEVPQELFTEEFTWPDYKTEDDRRKNLDVAMDLLQQAGWHLKDNRLVNSRGESFVINFLLPSQSLERATSFYITNLKRLGIDASMRTVDPSQYLTRRNNFDFDVIMEPIGQSSSPGNEQVNFFGSSSADERGSQNYAGIKNPAVDKLIDHLIHAQTREEVVATVKALDRVLLWNYYTVPNWTQGALNIAYWDKFGLPKSQPEVIGFDLFSWWIDKNKAVMLK